MQFVTVILPDDLSTSGSEFTLLYNVKTGSSNKSFGIEVAKLAGFPQEVVDNAQQYLLQAEMPKLRAQGKSTKLR